jgi:hypothetical protein
VVRRRWCAEVRPFLLRHCVVKPACSLLATLSGKEAMASHAAEVMLVAIALQESDATHRLQMGGPARGWWQFEKMGGLAGVMRHRRSGEIAESLCSELGISPSVDAAWLALPYSELLAAGLTRLLLWTDARPLLLPMPEHEDGAWDIYRDNWRPGKPRRERWATSWRVACDVCGDF